MRQCHITALHSGNMGDKLKEKSQQVFHWMLPEQEQSILDCTGLWNLTGAMNTILSKDNPSVAFDHGGGE